MSGRAKAGGVMMVLGYFVYLAAGVLALGSMLSGCVALSQGSIGGFVFAVGLAVVIGWIGQFVGGLIVIGGVATAGDD